MLHPSRARHPLEPTPRVTVLGSKVELYYEDGEYLFGRYWTGADWIPCKWFKNGRFVEDRECSLDLKL
jgi:hypothetical protein